MDTLKDYSLHSLPASEVHVLTSKDKWIIPQSTKGFESTYSFIKDLLKKNQGNGSDVSKNWKMITHVENGIQTAVLKVESHRMCTVAFCSQYNLSTDGVRFMVYGHRYNEDSEYGIGRSLANITKEYAIKYCSSVSGIALFFDA